MPTMIDESLSSRPAGGGGSTSVAVIIAGVGTDTGETPSVQMRPSSKSPEVDVGEDGDAGNVMEVVHEFS